MIRVHVICEGQTEEMFVQKVLVPALLPREVYLFPSLLGVPGEKGGDVKFRRITTDVRNRTNDRDSFITTLIDFYGLPSDFPGKESARNLRTPKEKADCVQNALRESICADNQNLAPERFLPYVQMYEFEGLLFSDPSTLAACLTPTRPALRFQQIRDRFETPEHINDSQQTAPSKRIVQIAPDYDKPLKGTLVALKIGLDVMRRECPLFNRWFSTLENLGHNSR